MKGISEAWHGRSHCLWSWPRPMADACSRAVYFGEEGQTITGRTMDWAVSDIDTNMWLYPRGLERNSNTAHPAGLDLEIRQRRHHDLRRCGRGRDERGGPCRQHALPRRVRVSARDEGDTRPTLPISAWAQYVLDNYATTAEAVEGLRQEAFRVVPIIAPTGEPGTVHLSISDASGDSAIFEFLDGKLVIHHGREFQIMTNSPTYDQQLALAAYWKNIGGSVMLPGTNRAADRFARMSYYINEATQTADPRRAVATVFSVMRNVSVPIGIKVPGQPNIADTLWLTVSGPEEQGLLLSGHQQPQHRLGQPERDGLQRRLGPAQADDGRQPRSCGRPVGELPADGTVQVHVAGCAALKCRAAPEVSARAVLRPGPACSQTCAVMLL